MDAPDWLGIPGSTRYLGTATIPGGTNQHVNFAIAPAVSDGMILAFPDPVVEGCGEYFDLSLVEVDLAVTTLHSVMGGLGWGPIGPFVAPITVAMGANWELDIHAYGTFASPIRWYVWAAPGTPATFVVANNKPIAVAPIVSGQNYPGSGLPVAAARASASAVSTPAVGVQATVTFSAVAGRQYVVAELDPSLTNNSAGAASIGDVVIRDGASGVGAVLFDVIAGVPIGYGATWAPTYRPPIAGTVGNAMTFEFVFPLPGAYERISASVYY